MFINIKLIFISLDNIKEKIRLSKLHCYRSVPAESVIYSNRNFSKYNSSMVTIIRDFLHHYSSYASRYGSVTTLRRRHKTVANDLSFLFYLQQWHFIFDIGYFIFFHYLSLIYIIISINFLI